MLITATGWKYEKDIGACARGGCTRQGVIDEAGGERAGGAGVRVRAPEGIHTHLWFFNRRQHVLNALRL